VDFKMKMHQGMHQSQRLVMNQRMQQALKLLQVPTLELEQVLRQELQINPLLEEYDPELDDLSEDDQEDEEEIDWDEYFSDGFKDGTNDREPEDEDKIDRPAPAVLSGQEDLNDQLSLAVDNDLDRRIGKYLIGSLGDDGFLTCPLREIAAYYETDIERVEAVLEILQGFDPPGIGARDLQECLLLQLKSKGHLDSIEAEVIKNHFDAIKMRKFADIAKILKITPLEVQDIALKIGELDPKPGMSSISDSAEYITPDLLVEKVGDEYICSLIDGNIPRLRVNKAYDKLTKESPGYDRDDVKFIDEKRSYAEWIIKTIEQRRRTMIKVMESIIEKQSDFFEHGPLGLKPLTLQQIADKIEMHESTVSRVTKQKYVQTPRGVFALKYFFSAGLDSANGEDVSAKAVRQMIEEVIAAEDSGKPLSDKKIVELLAERGTKIARRTVAKYREQLGILNARMRKQYS
jgi:RNA polymerase sigma-54 factor